MSSGASLVYEYRGEVLDLIHYGSICIVNDKGNILERYGNVEELVCYRSASKPIQALPIIARDIDKKYGFTDEEITIFSGSHAGEDFHIKALESMHKKANLSENDMIMNPTWPANEDAKIFAIKNDIGKRKLYHNCSGKHTALMLLQRELGGNVSDYWKVDSLAQKEVKSTICSISETTDAEISLDGCGVPVFSVPLKNIAIAYKNLACIDTIANKSLRQAAGRYIPNMHKYPLMVRGTGYMCSIMNMDPNIVAKGGANGVYGFGLKKQRIGVAFKLIDGTESSWPVIALKILKHLKVLTKEHEERLMSLNPYDIYNDNNTLAGKREAVFLY